MSGTKDYEDLTTDNDDARCCMEGCERIATVICDLCGESACQRHAEHSMAFELCPSCYIGVSEGMPEGMEGQW